MLANTVVNNWDDVFSQHLKREAKHLVHQVRKTRSRFAHQESFDHSDAYSALHEAQRLLEAIGADTASIVRSKRELVEGSEDLVEWRVVQEIEGSAEGRQVVTVPNDGHRAWFLRMSEVR